MARRVRITGRFYIFLLIVAIGIYFIVRDYIPQSTNEALITSASTTINTVLDCVIIRDETVGTCATGGRIIYIASEGQDVAEGEDICEVYTASYADKELSRLEDTRQAIREYHLQILDNIVDNQLKSYESSVQASAAQLKKLIRREIKGNILSMVSQLKSAMQARQNYLSQNRREDTKLNQLYEEETKRESALEAWRTLQTAETSGIVSFYLDGLESILTPNTLSSITPDIMRTVSACGIPKTEGTSSRIDNIYRIIGNDWYVAFLGNGNSWNPVNGQYFTFIFTGYEDLAYSGTIVQVQKSGQDVIAILKVNGSPRALVNERYGSAAISTHLSGLSVPLSAIHVQDEQQGVLLNDVPGGTFVPVNVLSTDKSTALISPLIEGTLEVGQTVLIN